MKIIITVLSLFYLQAVLALEPLGENEMDQILGLGGVYLSGDLTINDVGGPLNESGAEPGDAWQQDCAASTNERCGARIAVRTNNTSGWIVLDNLRGRFSFEGLTLKTRLIDSGFDNDGASSSDGASFDRDVFEIGLPNTMNFSNVSYTLANSNKARPTEVGFKQTDIFNVKIDGNVSLSGNLLLFPTGNP